MIDIRVYALTYFSQKRVPWVPVACMSKPSTCINLKGRKSAWSVEGR